MLKPGVFGVDYSTSPADNAVMARVSSPEAIALQDAKKRLTTDPARIFWAQQPQDVAQVQCMDLRDLLLDSGITPTGVGAAMRLVLETSPFFEWADVAMNSFAPSEEFKARVTLGLVGGQEIRLDIGATPVAVTVTQIGLAAATVGG